MGGGGDANNIVNRRRLARTHAKDTPFPCARINLDIAPKRYTPTSLCFMRFLNTVTLLTFILRLVYTTFVKKMASAIITIIMSVHVHVFPVQLIEPGHPSRFGIALLWHLATTSI